MKQKSLARYLVQYLRPYWPILVPGLIFVLVFTAFWPVLSRLAGQLSADLGNSDFNGLVKVALMGSGVYICQGIAQYGLTTSMAKVSFAITLDIRNQVYEHLLRLGSDYFAKTSVGDLAYRLTEDVDRIGETIYSMLHRFLPAFLQLIVMLGMMVYINWQLTIAVFVLAPIIALLVGWFGEKLQTQSRKSQNQVAEISATITEDFSGIRTIQAFAAERYRLSQLCYRKS
jgi:ATP-binding cassette, subfamily B, bacterial